MGRRGGVGVYSNPGKGALEEDVYSAREFAAGRDRFTFSPRERGLTGMVLRATLRQAGRQDSRAPSRFYTVSSNKPCGGLLQTLAWLICVLRWLPVSDWRRCRVEFKYGKGRGR